MLKVDLKEMNYNSFKSTFLKVDLKEMNFNAGYS